jgi:beta-glucanase (GH16 family)
MRKRAGDEVRGWDIAWSDEFDGPAGAPANPSIWHHELGGGGWGNDELQYYTDSTQNASLDGAGNLAIVARRTGPQPGESPHDGCGYTSARLVTKDTMAFSYGLVTARLKLPAAPGRVGLAGGVTPTAAVMDKSLPERLARSDAAMRSWLGC